MNSTGASARPGWKAFTAGTKLSSAMKTKYTLARRWNCSNRFLGRKDSSVYLVVLSRLSARCWTHPSRCSRSPLVAPATESSALGGGSRLERTVRVLPSRRRHRLPGGSGSSADPDSRCMAACRRARLLRCLRQPPR
ncbi:hypothetical protein H1C71_017300 [Ictidomys tridecemlineatus]|nr:hypothetical protein H1C71_017300 [Ictidomys tridecemlineatus]